MAVGTDPGKLYLVDTKTHATRWQAKIDGVAGLSFAPDGKTLAVATYGRVVLLDATNGTETNRFDAGRARQVAFAPDGKSVWVAGGGEPVFGNKDELATIRRWDLGTGTAVQTFETGPGMHLALALSADGKTLASGGAGFGPTLWDTATGKPTDLDPPGPRPRPWVQGLAFAPDGKTLGVADTNGRVRVWDVAAHRELHQYDEHTYVAKVAVSPDGTRAATGGGDGTVRIWDLTNGRSVRSWTADPKGSAFAAAFTPDGRSLLTCGWSGTLRLWDPATGTEVRRYRDEKVFVRVAALSPDGTLVAASGPGGMSIVLQETATGRTILRAAHGRGRGSPPTCCVRSVRSACWRRSEHRRRNGCYEPWLTANRTRV
jgi:WD40 repeat protein